MVQVVTILEEVVSGSDRHHFLQRYHEYARVGVKLPLRELYFDHNKNLWAPQTCAYATLRQSVANLMFRNVSFNFATAIMKFDTFSSHHIIRTQMCVCVCYHYATIKA